MMRIKEQIIKGLNLVLDKSSVQLISKTHVEQLLIESGRLQKNGFKKISLPEGAQDYLQPSNPRLLELKQRYLNHPATKHTQWTENYLQSELNLESFRGDNAYLYQSRVAADIKYLLTTYYVKSIDRLRLLDRLNDDDLFGNHLVKFDDKLKVSRDLLDSIVEINFLDETLGLSGLESPNILDIGAGYGRLAYRLVESLPNIGRVFCADSVAESTFLSEFYLRFRGVQERAVVVPLDEIEKTLESNRIDLATNIHSFSECSLDSINWWLDLLQRHKVGYLLVVPNDDELLTTEADGTRKNFLPALEARGYKLKLKQPKYSQVAGVQKYGAFPAEYYLFQNQS